MPSFLLEICLDSLASIREAVRGGAHRVELCDNLMEGGTTPSAGLIKQARAVATDIGLQVMIRPRGGDFLYDDDEFAAMRHDVELAGELGADGVVLGLLRADGRVDAERTTRLVELARPMNVTFHRAFDVTPDPHGALADIIALGCDRILTSGQQRSVLDGLPLITDLVQAAGDDVIIMPGCGITPHNFARIHEACGASEYHLKIDGHRDSRMTYRAAGVPMGGTLTPPEFGRAITDGDAVRALLE